MEISNALIRYLEDEGIENIPGESKEETLLAYLKNHISWLLTEKPERLMQIFYRLDVSETKVRKVLAEFPDSEWPVQLALLVLEREKLRLFWRQKYQSPGS